MGMTIQQGLNATNRVASTTDNTLPRFDGTAGALQTSGIVVDDSNNVSGVGTVASGGLTPSTVSVDPVIGTIQAANSFSAGISIRKRGATGDSAAAIGDGTEIGYHSFYGWDGSAYGRAAYVLVRSTDPFTGSAHGARYSIVTTTDGTTTEVARLTIGPGVQVGSPTGGDKGAGTLNATAVYDDNTLLTCYPFDAYLDGTIDDAKWDAKVPDRSIPATVELREVDTGEMGKDGSSIVRSENVDVAPARTEPRRHEDMRKFKARLGTDTDPLDLDKYIKHWREKRHLTSLPNEEKFDPVQGLPAGAWIQRLVETVEIQAIHISQLHERLKVLEGGR